LASNTHGLGLGLASASKNPEGLTSSLGLGLDRFVLKHIPDMDTGTRTGTGVNA